MHATHALICQASFKESECLYNAAQFLVRNNFYVLIDDHSEDPSVQNPSQWVQYYTQLMTDITADVPSRNRVMVDILNEPDHAGLGWTQVTLLVRSKIIRCYHAA